MPAVHFLKSLENTAAKQLVNTDIKLTQVETEAVVKEPKRHKCS